MKMWMEAATADVTSSKGLTEEELVEKIKERTAAFSDEQLGAMMKRVQEKYDRAARGVWKDVHGTLLEIEQEESDARKLIMDGTGRATRAAALRYDQLLKEKERTDKLKQKTWKAYAKKIRPRAIEEVVGCYSRLEWERLCRIKISKPIAEQRRMLWFLAGTVFLTIGLVIQATFIATNDKIIATLSGTIPSLLCYIASYRYGLYEQPVKLRDGQIEEEIEDRILQYVHKYEIRQQTIVAAAERKIQIEREARKARRLQKRKEEKRAAKAAAEQEAKEIPQEILDARKEEEERRKTTVHLRPACPVYPFTYGRGNESYCNFCRCYICDVPCEECPNWKAHCHATERNDHHKIMRTQSLDLRRQRASESYDEEAQMDFSHIPQVEPGTSEPPHISIAKREQDSKTRERSGQWDSLPVPINFEELEERAASDPRRVRLVPLPVREGEAVCLPQKKEEA